MWVLIMQIFYLEGIRVLTFCWPKDKLIRGEVEECGEDPNDCVSI